jgi:histidinol-phosphate aminotransferase
MLMSSPRRPLAPAHISAIAPYQPGKPIEELRRELGAAWPAEGAVKLASNENPLGPSPRAVAALIAAAGGVARYPDAGFELRERLTHHIGVDREQLILGSGSNEIINLIVQAFCGATEEVLTPRQQFMCYRLAAEGFGRALRETDNGPDFALDVEALLQAVSAATKVVFLANPNNPTGTHLGQQAIERLASALPADVVLVIDEAYHEYVDAPDYRSSLALLARRERLIVLRTFSKVYGLAGLRVGYAVSHPALVELLNRVRLPFNVSTVAQAAAMAALDDVEHVERTTELNTAERRRLTVELSQRGMHVTPSQGNFVLCATPAPFDGPGLYEALLRRGVIVRPLLPYGLRSHVRISVGTPAENERLLAELDHVAGAGR